MKIENEPAAKEAETLTGDALTIAFLKANLEDLRTGGIVTVAMTNPNVMSYMEHWEGRAEKAEKRVEELEATLRAHNSDSAEPVAWRCDHCGCKTHARIDVWNQNGRNFVKGDQVRCVECKSVTDHPLASPPAKEVEITEEMVERACAAFGSIRASNWFDRGQMRAALAAALTNRTPDDEVENG